MPFIVWLSPWQLKPTTDTIQLISALVLGGLRYRVHLSDAPIWVWTQEPSLVLTFMDGTRAIAFRTENLYFVVTQNNPLSVLSGMDAGKNLYVFHFFRSFLYLCLSWGLEGEGRKLLRCCRNIYTIIFTNNYITDTKGCYDRKVENAILGCLVEELQSLSLNWDNFFQMEASSLYSLKQNTPITFILLSSLLSSSPSCRV